jgi:hypothetical protein
MGTRSDKGRQESALQTQALNAVSKVEEPDEFEQRQRAHVLALDKWRTGEAGPLDIRNMPDGGIGIKLFRDAKQSRDAGRLGQGYGTLTDGANPNFSTALDKENQLSRDEAASGALDDYVTGTLGDLDAKMMGLSARSDSRDQAAAGLRQGIYQSFLNRPQRPSFLKQLALGFVSNAKTAAETAA